MTELERMRERFERAAEANVEKDAEIERLREARTNGVS